MPVVLNRNLSSISFIEVNDSGQSFGEQDDMHGAHRTGKRQRMISMKSSSYIYLLQRLSKHIITKNRWSVTFLLPGQGAKHHFESIFLVYWLLYWFMYPLLEKWGLGSGVTLFNETGRPWRMGGTLVIACHTEEEPIEMLVPLYNIHFL